jgi:hypothetical protein
MLDAISENELEDQSEAETQNNERSAFAPGTEIRFNPDLIEKLKLHHQALWELYDQLKDAFKLDNLSLLQQKLKEFRISFMDHILTENVSLYVYLSKYYSDDQSLVDLVKKTRSEMDVIGKNVRAFLLKYETMDADGNTFDVFSEDLESAITELEHRIATVEESIYPLYQ